MSAVRAGEIIAGKFQIERLLGEGGMGYVVAARHLQLGQRVALKFMREDVITSEYKSRFLREARNTVRLRSKHVSRVLDVGTLDDGVPYMVMEYLEGADLSKMLHGRGPLPVADACDYIIQSCEALAEAHGHNIVHRDLKPANLFLTRGSGGEPIIKVLDFGVSKVLDLGMNDETNPGGRGGYHDSVVTKASDLLGSPSYMAPEQVISARNADAKSDIWSLGVILFRLISGTAPFGGGSLGDLIQKITTGPIPNLRQLRSDIPPGLEHVVLRCMDRDRERRPDATELARLLAPYAGPNAQPSLERIAILGPALVASVPPLPPSAPLVASGAQGSWSPPHGGSNRETSSKQEMSVASAAVSALLFAVALAALVLAGAKIYYARKPAVPAEPAALPLASVALPSASIIAPPDVPPPPAPAAPLSVAPTVSTKPAGRSHPSTKPKPHAGSAPTGGVIPVSRE